MDSITPPLCSVSTVERMHRGISTQPTATCGWGSSHFQKELKRKGSTLPLRKLIKNVSIFLSPSLLIDVTLMRISQGYTGG